MTIVVQASGAPARWRSAWERFGASRWTIPAILLLALALRLAVVLAFPIDPLSDSQWYLARGREIAAGLGYQEGGLPTAFWPVGYPALIGLACTIFGPSTTGPVLFNLGAQGATILLTVWFARRLAAGEGAARIAALLYALYPAHIFYTGDTAAEPTSTAITMAGMALLVHVRGRLWPGLAAGVILGLATLMRAQILLFVPFILVPMVLTMPGFGWRAALRAGVLAGIGMAFVILPWTARNAAVLHTPVLVSTNGGIALQGGANPLTDGGYFQVEKSPLWAEVGIPFDQHVARQVEIDARLKRMAWQWIGEHPVRWCLLGLRKVVLLWAKDTDGFWAVDDSHPDLAVVWKAGQAANELFYLAVLALGASGFVVAARATWRRDAAAPLLVAAAMPVFCTALAFGFSGQTRYHYPAMPFMVIAAGFVLARWIDRRAAAWR